jgi:hypothetical protein
MNDDIMLLDAYQTIYVWIGNKSNSFEKKGSLASAQKYIDSIKDERDKENVQIVEVEAGKEAPSFTVHFSDWRLDKAQLWLEEDPFLKMKGTISQGGPKQPLNKTIGGGSPSKIGGGSPSKIGGGGTFNKSASSGANKEEAKVETVSSIVYADSSTTKFSYEVLKAKGGEGVDPTKKEQYLDEKEFQAVFGVTLDAFN